MLRRLAVFTVINFIAFSSPIAQQWTFLGNESQVASVASTYTSIAVIDTVPYVVYKEGAVAKVKRKNAVSGLWEQIGNNIGTNISHTKIYVDKVNNLFVSYVEGAAGNRLAVEMYYAATNTWEPLDTNSVNLYVSVGSVTNNVAQYSSTPRSSIAFDSNNDPYIAFGDGANLTPYVKKFNGTSWVTVGTGAVNTSDTAVAVGLVIDEVDIPWLAFCNLSSPTSTAGSLALYSFSGGTWSQAATSIGGIRHTSMALNSAGNLAIAYFGTTNSNKATAVVYNKTNNTMSAATSLSTRDAPNLSLINDIYGNLYCSFVDYVSTTPRAVARVFKQKAGTTTWAELKDPITVTGIDEPVGNLAIAAASDSSKAFIVYTKTNSASIVTPVVRLYIPPAAPSVLTSTEVAGITYTSATGGGNIISDGGSAITERGIVYGTGINPTIANTKAVATSIGSGSFTVTFSGFAHAVLYYVRAYAINAGGITYGNNVNFFAPPAADPVVTTPRQMEFLTRGVVAVRTSTTKVYIGWRMLGTDSAGISFNVYRDGVKVNATPITNATNLEDNTTANGSYTIKPVISGVEGAASAPVAVWANNQLVIPLDRPEGGITLDSVAYTYDANDCSVGDVDGDGEYEIFVKWDPTNSKDNSQGGYTGNVYIDCYKMNGTRLWRVDLGRNIRAGAHYTQFMVYDFDGDGKAEMMCKTADATKDGVGTIIGNSTADYRSTAGYILTGPEFITVFNGLTGAAMATKNFIPARGIVSDWGDGYGNRVDRFISSVAYLDGQRPTAIFGRGYYTRLVRAAWDWRSGQLTSRWVFDSNTPGNGSFYGMGNHQMTVGDVDGDGKDEIINGSSIVNDDGKALWADGKGHGDALHMTDMDPSRPGQEIWMNHEEEGRYTPSGIRLKDAKTGATLWGKTTTGDVGRSMVADIDPTHLGYEVWASSGNLYDVKGNQIANTKPSYNFGIWWDGDLARELLDGTKLDKWNYINNTSGRLLTIYQAAPVSPNNSTKANPCLQADLLGDWREEMIFRRSDNTALVLFTTNILTDKRIFTLMHDPQYRTGVAWQNSAYNQPPYPSFYLGFDMATPPPPNIYLTGAGTTLPVQLLSFDAKADGSKVALNWSTEKEKNNQSFTIERSANRSEYAPIYTTKSAGDNGGVNNYTAADNHPFAGTNYYRLKQADFDGRFSYSPVRAVNFSGNENAQLTVFPNPVANAAVQLQLPASANAVDLKLVINSAEGKQVLQVSGTLQQLNTELNKNIQVFAKGTYILQVIDQKKTYTTKMVKQ